jgi:hypothetical protein
LKPAREKMPMNPRVPILLLASVAASCGQSDEQRAQPARASNAAAALPQPAAPAPASPPAVSPREAEAETPPSATGARAAADVLKAYYRLIEAGRYEQAWRLRWDSDAGDASDFAAHFADYAEYHATIGNPGEIGGAAGSSYVEVPVQLYGRMKSGESFGSAGTVTLRRVNDVPGATAAQLRWRIYTSE